MFVITWAHIGALGGVLSVIGALISWWWKTVSKEYDRSIAELEKSSEKQWSRIDEMREAVVKKSEFDEQRRLVDQIRTTYVSTEAHERARTELRDDFREAIRPLKESIEKLGDQMAKIAERMVRNPST